MGMEWFYGETRMSVDVVKGMYEVVVVLAVSYGSETWVINARDASHVEAVKMRSLRSIRGITEYNSVRNEKVR